LFIRTEGFICISIEKELTRTDSTLSHLMTYEGKRRKRFEQICFEQYFQYINCICMWRVALLKIANWITVTFHIRYTVWIVHFPHILIFPFITYSTESITSETVGTSSKVADSGLGGLASSEENWVSDNDDDEVCCVLCRVYMDWAFNDLLYPLLTCPY
jgi:hypothetical protein